MKQLAQTFDPNRWIPPPDLIDGYRIQKFLVSTGLADMDALWAKAAADPEWFYPAAHSFLDLPWLRPWTMVRDASAGEPNCRWFVNGRTNLAWLAVERWLEAPHPAVVWEREDGQEGSLSFLELNDLVRRTAAGLRSLSVGQGDVVTMFLHPGPEAIVTMLAVARIGAVTSLAFSGYGVDALAERIRLAGAKVIVTADGTVRRGQEFELLPTAVSAANQCPSLERIVVVPRLGRTVPAGSKFTSWDDLLARGCDGPVEALDSGTPWLLAFTSGSTGRPKGAVHTHGGFGYSLGLDLGLGLDVGFGDRFLWPADMGWLAGPMLGLGPLVVGATTVLYDGLVDANGPDALWRLIEKHRVTHYGTAPTMIRLLADHGLRAKRFELDSLRILASAGEPMTLGAWRWLHQHVGRGRRPIINFTGGTEVGGNFLQCYANVPTDACHFSGPNLGIVADVIDDHGRSLVGEVGELVIRRSWPSMTQGLWNEPERFIESYWSKIPGVWVHGDRAIRYQDGSYEVPGRSDDVLKLAGKRVGPSEMESLASEVEGVTSAAAIGVPHPTKGDIAVLLVTIDPQHRHDEGVDGRVADKIEGSFGRALRPQAVLVVDNLPLTGSGKIHRRVLRGWICGEDPGDISTVANPEVQEELLVAGKLLDGVLGKASI